MTNTLTKANKSEQKKKIRPCTIKKRDLIIATYRKNGGDITSLIESTKIGRTRFYEILEQYPKVREEIDSFDERIIEEDKDKAVEKLRSNVKAGLQRAIEYTIEKQPRKERGKIVFDKDEIVGPSIELYLGVRQEVIIE